MGGSNVTRTLNHSKIYLPTLQKSFSNFQSHFGTPYPFLAVQIRRLFISAITSEWQKRQSRTLILAQDFTLVEFLDTRNHTHRQICASPLYLRHSRYDKSTSKVFDYCIMICFLFVVRKLISYVLTLILLILSFSYCNHSTYFTNSRVTCQWRSQQKPCKCQAQHRRNSHALNWKPILAPHRRLGVIFPQLFTCGSYQMVGDHSFFRNYELDRRSSKWCTVLSFMERDSSWHVATFVGHLNFWVPYLL